MTGVVIAATNDEQAFLQCTSCNLIFMSDEYEDRGVSSQSMSELALQLIAHHTYHYLAESFDRATQGKSSLHPNCQPTPDLGNEAHDVCPDCRVRWCEPSPLCPKVTFNRHPKLVR